MEVETLILGVVARERAERNLGHHAFGALGQGAGLVETTIEAPAGAGVGFEVDFGADRGAGVRAVLTVEGHAFGLHPAAGPSTGATERFRVEGITGFTFAEVHEDGLVRGATLLVEGAFALGVIDRGRQESSVVHRFPLGEGWGFRLLGRLLREASQGHQRQGEGQGGAGHEFHRIGNEVG